MRSSSPTVFAMLDAEWATLAPSPIPADWQRHPALARTGALQPSLGDLLQATERRGDPEASDQILAALAHLATTTDDADPLAARVLLQMLLPGAKALARRLSWLGDTQERAAAITATLYEQIRTYPITRRPARIAANLLADTHQRLIRRSSASGSAGAGSGSASGGTALAAVPALSLDQLAAHGVLPELTPPGPAPAEELLALLAWAVHSGYLTAAQARLIGRSRIADIPCEQLGAVAGLGAHSLRRRRQRAEQALGRAVTACALTPDDHSHLLPYLEQFGEPLVRSSRRRHGRNTQPCRAEPGGLPAA